MPWKNVLQLMTKSLAVVGMSAFAITAPINALAADIACQESISRPHGENIAFTVPWSPNTGFEQEVEFRNARTGAGIS